MNELRVRVRIEELDEIFVGYWKDLPDFVESKGHDFSYCHLVVLEVYPN
jgi:hypothetical protein